MSRSAAKVDQEEEMNKEDKIEPLERNNWWNTSQGSATAVTYVDEEQDIERNLAPDFQNEIGLTYCIESLVATDE